jgi:hypothetical protein
MKDKRHGTGDFEDPGRKKTNSTTTRTLVEHLAQVLVLYGGTLGQQTSAHEYGIASLGLETQS